MVKEVFSLSRKKVVSAQGTKVKSEIPSRKTNSSKNKVILNKLVVCYLMLKY